MSKLKKKLKTQGKNSKLKTKTQFFGIFRILRCEKGVQKKSLSRTYRSSGLFLGVLAKTQFVQNAKTQFENTKTQFENAKTQFEY